MKLGGKGAVTLTELDTVTLPELTEQMNTLVPKEDKLLVESWVKSMQRFPDTKATTNVFAEEMDKLNETIKVEYKSTGLPQYSNAKCSCQQELVVAAGLMEVEENQEDIRKNKAKHRQEHQCDVRAVCTRPSLDMAQLLRVAATQLQRFEFDEACDKYQHVYDTLIQNSDVEDRQIQLLTFTIAHCTYSASNTTMAKLGKAYRLLGPYQGSFSKFPLFYLAGAMLCVRANFFEDAFEPLKAARIFLERVFSFDEYNWPGCEMIIPDSNYEVFQDKVEKLLNECFHPPTPDHSCKGENCRLNGYRRNQIYYSDPDFNGYVRLTCRRKCHIDFHADCWKDMLKKNDTVKEKELVGLDCLTPDCDGTIELIEIFKGDRLLKKRITLDGNAHLIKFEPRRNSAEPPKTGPEELRLTSDPQNSSPPDLETKLADAMKRSAQLEGEKEKLQDQLEAEKDHSFQMVSKVKAELEKDKLVIALLEDQLQKCETERDRYRKLSREADKYKDLLRHSNEQLESLKKKVTNLELDAEKQRKEVKRLENLVKDLKKYLKKSTIENHRDEILDIFDDAIECYNNAMKRAEEAEVLYLRTRRNYELFVAQAAAESVKRVVDQCEILIQHLKTFNQKNGHIAVYEDYKKLHESYLRDYDRLKVTVEKKFDDQISQVITGTMLSDLEPIRIASIPRPVEVPIGGTPIMSEGDAKPMASLHPPKQEIIYDYWNDHPLLPTDSNDSKQRITHIPSPSASGICRPGRFSATFYSIVPDIMNHQSVRNEPGSDPEIFGLNVDSKAIFTSAVSDALTSSMPFTQKPEFREVQRPESSPSLRFLPPPRPAYSSLEMLETFDDFVNENPRLSPEEMCAICHDSLIDMPVAQIDCGHEFHEECLRPWIEKNKTCPMCRNLTLPDNEFPRLNRCH